MEKNNVLIISLLYKTLIIVFIITFSIMTLIKPLKVNAEEEILSVDYNISREFRAVWVSPLVSDIPRYSNQTQYKNAITTVLNNMEANNLNVMIFHIRIYNDALYKSMFNSWSSYYSANPDWDALPWIIEECHKRGIEFHAWMNPYRVSTRVGSTLESIASTFPYTNPASNPDNLLKGSTTVILDPGLPEVQYFLVRTCMEVVRNYDIDAIHFDDYFYVDKVDDESTYLEYGMNQGIDQFRRDSVDTFIRDLHNEIALYNKENNKSIELGISPTAAWLNGDGVVTYDEDGKAISNGSKGITQSHYGSYLYCDTLKWVNESWIDYIIPQCYAGLSEGNELFYGAVDWWSKVCLYSKTKLYIGIGLYRASTTGDWSNENELLTQFKFMDNYDNIGGFAIFSYKSVIAGGMQKTNLNNAKEYFEGYVLPLEVINSPLSNKEEISYYYIINDGQKNKIYCEDLETVKYYMLLKEVNGQIELVGVKGEGVFEDSLNTSGEVKYYLAPIYRDNTIGNYVLLSSTDKYKKVTFLDINENVIEEKYVLDGDDINYPSLSDVEGYEFISWEKDDTSQDSTTYKAKYKIKEFTIIYYLNNEKYFEETVEYGMSGSLVNFAPVGSKFNGWDKDISSIKEDISVYGSLERNECKINLYNGNSKVYTIECYYNDTINILESLDEETLELLNNREGYNFIGFTYQGEIVNEITVEKNISMYSKYEIITYEVTYNLDGGSSNKLVDSFDYNHFPALPQAEKEGFIFLGWYENNEKVEAFTNKNYFLSAKWEAKVNTITLNANGGNVENTTYEFTSNEKVTLPIPTRDGYDFVGWEENGELLERFENRDYVLNARWQKKNSGCQNSLSVLFSSIIILGLVFIRKRS